MFYSFSIGFLFGISSLVGCRLPTKAKHVAEHLTSPWFFSINQPSEFWPVGLRHEYAWREVERSVFNFLLFQSNDDRDDDDELR